MSMTFTIASVLPSRSGSLLEQNTLNGYGIREQCVEESSVALRFTLQSYNVPTQQWRVTERLRYIVI